MGDRLPQVFWDHQGGKSPFYTIYPVTPIAEEILPVNVVLRLPQAARTDRLVQLLTDTLDTLILAREWEKGER